MPAHTGWRFSLGALPAADESTTGFRVWAPYAQKVELVLLTADGAEERAVLLQPESGPERAGYHQGSVDDAPPGRLYRYRLHPRDGGAPLDRPDPASRAQPHGVHGPSRVVARPEPPAWPGLPLAGHVLYELHVGAFTEAGTFDAAGEHLAELADLGVTAVELMPVCPFPGRRNWGYDGVFPFAVHHGYGGPDGLRRFVARAHEHGLAVVLDVVYNHFGPEGNALPDFGPWFTRRYATPWGDALNLDGPHCDPVRDHLVEAAVHWIAEHGIDGLRLDAVDAIVDHSERPFLVQLAAAVQAEGEARGRPVHLFAESGVNTRRYLRSREHGGCGVDAQWSDDFHHALHALLTGETRGYYADFGKLEHLARAYRRGWTYAGDYSVYRQRRHGVSSRGLEAQRFVVCAQNHDQVGNRPDGARLATLTDPPRLRLAAAATLLSPFLPLLFMGEEHGEDRPFHFFTDYGDGDLARAVAEGRARELADFGWQGEPPDPQAETTFTASRLARDWRDDPGKRALRALHRRLLELRRTVPALARLSLDDLSVTTWPTAGVLTLWRRAGDSEAFLALRFADEEGPVELPLPEGEWTVALDSRTDDRDEGRAVTSTGAVALDLPPWGFALLLREG